MSRSDFYINQKSVLFQVRKNLFQLNLMHFAQKQLKLVYVFVVLVPIWCFDQLEDQFWWILFKQSLGILLIMNLRKWKFWNCLYCYCVWEVMILFMVNGLSFMKFSFEGFKRLHETSRWSDICWCTQASN